MDLIFIIIVVFYGFTSNGQVLKYATIFNRTLYEQDN